MNKTWIKGINLSHALWQIVLVSAIFVLVWTSAIKIWDEHQRGKPKYFLGGLWVSQLIFGWVTKNCEEWWWWWRGGTADGQRPENWHLLPPFISPLVANTQISCPSTHFLFGSYPLLVAIIIIIIIIINITIITIIFIFNLTYCFGGWINQTNKDVLLLSYSCNNDWLLMLLLFWRETLNFLSVSFLNSKICGSATESVLRLFRAPSQTSFSDSLY